jgi:hypothetical protein
MGVAHGVIGFLGGFESATPLDYDPTSLDLPNPPGNYAIFTYPFDVLLPLPWGVSTPSAHSLQATSRVAGTMEVGTLMGVDSNQIYPGSEPGYVMPKVDTATLHGLIDWGDGTSSVATFVTDLGGTVHIMGTHTFDAPGSYAVRATVWQDPVFGPSQDVARQTAYPNILLPIIDSAITAT